jgi:hypothetical protein
VTPNPTQPPSPPQYPPQQQPWPQQYQQHQYPQQQYAQQAWRPNDGMVVLPTNQAFYDRGKRLVFWSRMILLAGVVLTTSGCGGMIASTTSGFRGFFGIVLLVGVPLFIVAAVVGTVGRRMQGRIV